MMGGFSRYGAHLSYSVVLHLFFLGLFLVSFSDDGRPVTSQPVPESVQATVLDESEIQAEIDGLRRSEENQRQQERLRQEQLEKEGVRAAERLARLEEQTKLKQAAALEAAEQRKAQNEAEAKKIALLKKQKAEEEQRLIEVRKQKEAAQKKQQEEAEKIAQLKRQKKKEEDHLEKIRKQEEALDKKRRAEEERLAGLETKRQAEEEKREAARRASDQKEREAAKARQRAETARRTNEQIAYAKTLIQQKVNGSWLRPSSTGQGLSCKIQVKLIPGGDVIDARVIRSSGDPTFDRSAEVAVLKASPLPLPVDPELFSTFRNFDFEFRPDS